MGASHCLYGPYTYLVGGFNHLENMKVNGKDYRIYHEKKDWNHQPVYITMFIDIASYQCGLFKSILHLPSRVAFTKDSQRTWPPSMKPAIRLYSSSYHSVCRELAHAVAGACRACQSSGSEDVKDILGLRKFEKRSKKNEYLACFHQFIPFLTHRIHVWYMLTFGVYWW